MERREISVGLGTITLKDGRKIVTNVIRFNQGVIAGDTAKHETDHGLVAEMTGSAVSIMTIVPGPGYYGKVEFKSGQLNPTSAAAAEARGRSGTSWDRYITVAHGHNWQDSKNAAKAVLDANHDVHDEIAKELEAQKTMDSSDIWRVIDRTRNPEVRIAEIDKDGKEVRSMVDKVRKVDGKVSYFIEEDLEDRRN